jgi:hypothetical protein
MRWIGATEPVWKLWGREKYLLLSVIEPRPACSLATIPTELFRFLFSFKGEIFGLRYRNLCMCSKCMSWYVCVATGGHPDRLCMSYMREPLSLGSSRRVFVRFLIITLLISQTRALRWCVLLQRMWPDKYCESMTFTCGRINVCFCAYGVNLYKSRAGRHNMLFSYWILWCMVRKMVHVWKGYFSPSSSSIPVAPTWNIGHP